MLLARLAIAKLGTVKTKENEMLGRVLGDHRSKLLVIAGVTVDLRFPKVLPSLSQHTVFVARFRGAYWVWGIGH